MFPFSCKEIAEMQVTSRYYLFEKLTLPATDPQKKLNKNVFFSKSDLLNAAFVVSNVDQYIPKSTNIYTI